MRELWPLGLRSAKDSIVATRATLLIRRPTLHPSHALRSSPPVLILVISALVTGPCASGLSDAFWKRGAAPRRVGTHGAHASVSVWHTEKQPFLFVCDPLSSHTRSICLSPRYESLREQSVVWSCWSQPDFAKSLDLVRVSIWAVHRVVSHNLILKTIPPGTVSFSCIGCMI